MPAKSRAARAGRKKIFFISSKIQKMFTTEKTISPLLPMAQKKFYRQQKSLKMLPIARNLRHRQHLMLLAAAYCLTILATQPPPGAIWSFNLSPGRTESSSLA